MEDDTPLTGLTVVSIEQAVAAPLCTARLADAGARVIKIERPQGETARHYDAVVHGASAYFVWLNRGKESAVLNLKDAADLELLRRMLAKADVLVQNLVPGAFGRLGLTPETVLALNPRLIMLSIVGYGQDTDYADMRAYDMLIQAESGLCAITGTDDTPSKTGASVADIATGMTAHAAILEALIQRGITGKGKSIEVSMFDCLADWMNVPLLHFEQAGLIWGRNGLQHASIYPYRSFKCADGDVMVAVQTADEWVRLCRDVLERPALAADDRFDTNPKRSKNRSILDPEMEPVFASLTQSEAIARLDRAGLAFGRVCGVPDLSAHPSLRRIEGVANGQVYSMAAPPLHPKSAPAPIPDIGEQTDKIRTEFS
ncbi:CaiB/BaiF CoA transferase family protein [Litoreibacter roseus]|uniref:CoA transferase n=1 Tax=Litoreibacter roseus TaxID=2601869 RepID=A0A6N6JHD9_9RHOB|nr:CaiB/BaiF CoA-transferase family protein [Litoreibacter roseus]GFE64799.1 CoA transferase [Litoreibacter roseus]